jgi:hypothetical protein
MLQHTPGPTNIAPARTPSQCHAATADANPGLLLVPTCEAPAPVATSTSGGGALSGVQLLAVASLEIPMTPDHTYVHARVDVHARKVTGAAGGPLCIARQMVKEMYILQQQQSRRHTMR